MRYASQSGTLLADVERHDPGLAAAFGPKIHDRRVMTDLRAKMPKIDLNKLAVLIAIVILALLATTGLRSARTV